MQCTIILNSLLGSTANIIVGKIGVELGKQNYMKFTYPVLLYSISQYMDSTIAAFYPHCKIKLRKQTY